MGRWINERSRKAAVAGRRRDLPACVRAQPPVTYTWPSNLPPELAAIPAASYIGLLGPIKVQVLCFLACGLTAEIAVSPISLAPAPARRRPARFFCRASGPGAVPGRGNGMTENRRGQRFFPGPTLWSSFSQSFGTVGRALIGPRVRNPPRDRARS